MQIVHVIPIARGMGKETLTYFTAADAPVGSVVSVPLRKRIVPAIVVERHDAADAKAALRHAAYALRKTTHKKPWQFLSPACAEAIAETARHHAGTKGATLHAIVPGVLWESTTAEKLAPLGDSAKYETSDIIPERFILQAENEERISRYRGLVRESFARGNSLFLCVPTIAEGERLKRALGRGIEQYLFLLHSSLSKKALTDSWRQALSEEHPVVIIGTPSFLVLSRRDLSTIVIERENASAYKQQTRPYIDLRVFVEHFARAKRARLIFAGLPLRTETMWRHEQHELEALVPPKLHPRSSVKSTVIDMRERRDKDNAPKKKRVFKVISDDLAELIKRTLEKNERVFLFAPRRGISPMTVCADCGAVVTCEDSNEPVVLYRGLEKNVFVCQSTGVVRSAEERCRACSSWRLQSLGIGSERIDDEVHERFPDTPIMLFDSDNITTHRVARHEAQRFQDMRGAIMIGTEMALPYLNGQLTAVAVISLDSLLSNPEWRMSEKTFALLLTLRDMAAETFLVQTRRPDERVIRCALDGDTMGFYRDELSVRELLRYPPFTILIKISSTGTPARVQSRMKELEKLFAEYKLRVYLPTVRVSSGRFAMHGLLRVPRNKWPDKQLLDLLGALPPHFSVQVDPERLL